MAEQLRHFDFQNVQVLDTSKRQASALEFIAYYLDHIEQHLARAAETNEKIQASLSAIAQAMPKIVSGVNQ